MSGVVERSGKNASGTRKERPYHANRD
jgi:hypothetical protein